MTADEVYLLIKNNLMQANLIVNYFLEKGRYERTIAIGKLIALDHL